MMWTCPKCGRTFKKANQGHYCGEAPKTIDEYIARQEHQEELQLIRTAVREILPDASEKISWSMPTFWDKSNIVQFAAFAHHIGFYPGPQAVEHFEEQLKEYKHSKGSIQLPYGKPVPVEMIKEIVLWCRETGNHV